MRVAEANMSLPRSETWWSLTEHEGAGLLGLCGGTISPVNPIFCLWMVACYVILAIQSHGSEMPIIDLMNRMAETIKWCSCCPDHFGACHSGMIAISFTDPGRMNCTQS